MTNLFYTVLSLSYKSIFVVIFILAVRFLIRKLPKSYSFALWAVLAFRLICPVSFESAVSLFNNLPDKAYYINTIIPSSGGITAQNNFNTEFLNTNTAQVQNAVNTGMSFESIKVLLFMFILPVFWLLLFMVFICILKLWIKLSLLLKKKIIFITAII